MVIVIENEKLNPKIGIKLQLLFVLSQVLLLFE